MEIMRRKLGSAQLTAEEAERTIRNEGDWELWDGVAVLCDPAGGFSGPLGAELIFLLRQTVDRRDGWVGGASTG